MSKIVTKFIDISLHGPLNDDNGQHNPFVMQIQTNTDHNIFFQNHLGFLCVYLKNVCDVHCAN